MSRPIAYVALQQFCEDDSRPRQVLVDAGFEVRQNTRGHRLRREEMVEALGEADAVLAGVEPYDAALLAALPRLRCISRCGAATDSIDLAAAALRGVTVYRTVDEVVEPVAQMTVAMILALARQLPRFAADAREGRWRKHRGFLLSEWTVGLIGFGRIGRAVARYLRPFGPRVLAADPHVDMAARPEGVAGRTLPALLAESDVVSVHADRPPSEGALIRSAELARMKRGSYLVNTARGHLVDETALYDALRADRLAGAALDVFEREPYAGRLTTLPQVLCTPHVASLTRASRRAMELRCAQHVVEWQARQSTAAEVVSASRPTVSVVIVTYNKAETIGSAVESVLRQTYRDLEILVVDDGSMDDTAQRLRGFGDRLQYLAKPHGGTGSARNLGIAAARGRYVAFLDGDDLWLPQKLERQMAAFDREPDILAVQCSTDCVNNALEVFETRRCDARRDTLLDFLLFRNLPAFSSAVVVQRSCFERIGGFATDLVILSDWDMACRLAQIGTVRSLPEVLVLYRHYPSNQSRDVGIHLKPGMRSLRRLFAKPSLDPAIRAQEARVWARFYAMMAGGYARNGEWARGLRWTLKAIRTSPRIGPYILAMPIRRVKRMLRGPTRRSFAGELPCGVWV